MDIDEALAVVGGLRRYHISVFISIALSSYMPVAGMIMMFVFIAYTPPHHCKVPPGQLINETIPEVPGQYGQPWSKCSMYVNSSISNETMACPNGWTYYADGGKTIITEWDLVCQYNYLAELSETMARAGSLVTQTPMSLLVDRYGRRKVHLAGIVLVIICGICLAVAPNYIMFLIFRPLTAASLGALGLPGETMLIELFDSKLRTFAGVFMQFLWSFAYMYLALLGYLISDWRTLVLVLALTNVVFLFQFVTLPESVRWLTANGRYDEAEEILQKMARYNKVKVEGRLLKQSSKASSKKEESSGQEKSEFSSTPLVQANADAGELYEEKFSDLFTNPILRKHTIIGSLMWFASELVYYGIILTTPSLLGIDTSTFFSLAWWRFQPF